jgi:hypothetical protein
MASGIPHPPPEAHETGKEGVRMGNPTSESTDTRCAGLGSHDQIL